MVRNNKYYKPVVEKKRMTRWNSIIKKEGQVFFIIKREKKKAGGDYCDNKYLPSLNWAKIQNVVLLGEKSCVYAVVGKLLLKVAELLYFSYL